MFKLNHFPIIIYLVNCCNAHNINIINNNEQIAPSNNNQSNSNNLKINNNLNFSTDTFKINKNVYKRGDANNKKIMEKYLQKEQDKKIKHYRNLNKRLPIEVKMSKIYKTSKKNDSSVTVDDIS